MIQVWPHWLNCPCWPHLGCNFGWGCTEGVLTCNAWHCKLRSCNQRLRERYALAAGWVGDKKVNAFAGGCVQFANLFPSLSVLHHTSTLHAYRAWVCTTWRSSVFGHPRVSLSKSRAFVKALHLLGFWQKLREESCSKIAGLCLHATQPKRIQFYVQILSFRQDHVLRVWGPRVPSSGNVSICEDSLSLKAMTWHVTKSMCDM